MEVGSRIRVLVDTPSHDYSCTRGDDSIWIIRGVEGVRWGLYCGFEEDIEDTYYFREEDCVVIQEEVVIDPNKPIEVGDIVTYADTEQIKREANHYNVDINQVWATITKPHDVDGAWYFSWNHRDYTSDCDYGYNLRQCTGIIIPQVRTTLTQKYPFIKEVLSDMYGDNYDVQEVECKEERLEGSIIIKYPEVHISNSNGDTHTMKDLYVKIEFNRGKVEKSLYGFRGLLSYKEYKSEYNHSHLPRRNQTWNRFCLGSGTDIEFALAEANENFTEDTFMKLLANIDSYVAWESIEGGPYINIVTIHTANVESGIGNITINAEYLAVKDGITKELPLKYIDEYIPYFQIDKDENKLEECIGELISTKALKSKTSGKIYNEHENTENISRLNESLKDYNITYKGEEVYRTVEDSKLDVDMSMYYEVAHPYVVSKVVDKLNEDLKKFILG